MKAKCKHSFKEMNISQTKEIKSLALFNKTSKRKKSNYENGDKTSLWRNKSGLWGTSHGG